METVKFNVEFEIEVPVKYDTAGRRQPICNLVAPYLDDFMQSVQYGSQWKIKGFNPSERNEDRENFEAEMASLMGSPEMQERLKQREIEAAERHDRWVAEQEEQHQELYGMSVSEFTKLTPQQKADIRKERSVTWKDGAWVRLH